MWRYSSKNKNKKTGSSTRIYGRYIKFLDKQVYGISTTEKATLKGKKKWMLSKVAHNISALGGALYLMGNVPGGTVNTLTGFNNIFKEATSCDYYDLKDWIFANGWYIKYWPQMTWEMGKKRKDNKLSLFLDYMDFQGQNKGKFKAWHTERSRVNNLIRDLGYMPYSIGDHYMQAISLLSLAHGTKMYDSNGHIIKSLWDAYSKVVNEAEENLKGRAFSAGHSLKFDRLCPLDASEITTEALNNQGVYLKKAEKNTDTFNGWLITMYPDFLDETYTKNHIDDKVALRKQFMEDMSDKERQDYISHRYKMLANILQKTEDYINNIETSPLLNLPVFTQEEQNYLDFKKIGNGQYSDILQSVREDIYRIIWSKNDEAKFMGKSREINNRLHGIYNEADKTAAHQQWYFNAMLSMKGWALGNLEMMYSSNHHSIALDKNVEGFINTAGKLAFDMIFGAEKNKINLTNGLLALTCPWSKRVEKAMKKADYSEEQNKNMRRMAITMYLITLLHLLELGSAPDDDDDEDQLTGGVYYLAMRELLEQEALVLPSELFLNAKQIGDIWPVGGSALYDLGDLVYQTAGAAIGNEEDSDFFYQNDSNDDRYEEGDPKYYNHMIRLIPYWKSLWALEHPYGAAENYEFGRKMTVK